MAAAENHPVIHTLLYSNTIRQVYMRVIIIVLYVVIVTDP